MISIVRVDKEKFIFHKDEILELFMETSTTGPMEQYLDRDEEWNFLEADFEHEGYAYLAFDGEKVIGFIITCSLEHDSLLPDSIKKSYPINACYYVSEMHILPEYQGKGIGTRMMQKLIDEVDRHRWEYLFIRSWKNNEGAMRFYERFGFELGETINQDKIRKDMSPFVIQKQYMMQKL